MPVVVCVSSKKTRGKRERENRKQTNKYKQQGQQKPFIDTTRQPDPLRNLHRITSPFYLIF